MLSLVFADGYAVGVVEEDVGCHEHGIAEQTGIDAGLCPGAGVGELYLAGGVRLLVLVHLETELGDLFLELRHALELAYGREAGENPGKLGVSGDVRLGELVTFFGIETASDVLGDALEHVAPKVGRLVGDGDGVHVDNAEIALEVVQHGGPISYRTQVIT